MELLARGKTGGVDIPLPTENILEQLERDHYAMWLEARDEHQAKNASLVAYRRENLETSHEARVALLEEQLHQAANENIRRMKLSQLESAKADYERRFAELEAAGSIADITTERIAYGSIRILGKERHA